MRQFIKIVILLALCAAAAGWYVYRRGTVATHASEGSSANPAAGAPGAGKPGAPPVAIPVGMAHVRERTIPIYLDGLGTVQALQTITIHPQVEGVVEKVDFVEGQDVKIGQTLAEIDPRTYRAQLDQVKAKKLQDAAKTDQDRAKITQDQAKTLQDQSLEKQAQARQLQDQALEKQADAKKQMDVTNLNNSRVNLKRFQESFKTNAVSEQVVTDQQSLVSQLESTVQADDASIAAIQASIQGDVVAIQAVQASVQGDQAAVVADQAAVKGDEAAVLADDGAISYAQTFLSYCTIKSPINGRTGVRMVDAGNLLRTTDTTGIVVLTQLQPISVVFTLPQQNLQAINARRAESTMTVIAVDSDGKTELDRGELLLVDNQIDPTTGTIRLKATFPNAKFKLWPGGFVDVRLLIETRQNALVVAAPAVQQGPHGTFVFLIKPDQTVEMRSVKVSLIQDGKAILSEGVAKDDEVVLSGHDRLKNGTKVSVDRTKADKTNGEKKPVEVITKKEVSETQSGSGEKSAPSATETAKEEGGAPK